MRGDAERLADIVDAIDKVLAKLPQDPATFFADQTAQVGVAWHLQIVGEAARHLTDETRSRAPQVPWTQMIGMRNILVHEYFGLDVHELWQTAKRDLAPLRQHIQQLL